MKDFVVRDGVERNGYLPGYYLQKDGTKIDGEIQYNFPYIMEHMLVFRKDGRSTFIDPKDIKGYFVDGIYRESVTINVSMIAGMKSLETYFMIPEIQGKLSLYQYSAENPESLASARNISVNNYYDAYTYYNQRSESEIQKFTPKTRYIQMTGEPATAVDNLALSFANKMSKMISDCADLASKVKAKEKEYRSDNLEKIVNEYNACGQ